MCGSTNKSPIKLNAVKIKFDIGDLFTNRENLMAKIPLGDFQVTTPETPLLTQQTVTCKGIPSTLPTYN